MGAVLPPAIVLVGRVIIWIVFGDTPGLDRLDARWNKLVSIVDAREREF